jgi:hypothetical protein
VGAVLALAKVPASASASALVDAVPVLVQADEDAGQELLSSRQSHAQFHPSSRA